MPKVAKDGVAVERKLIRKDDNHEYGVVTRKLGGGHFSIRLNLQNREVIGRVRGKFRKGAGKKENWVDIDSVVLVSFRDFQDKNVDIVHVYNSSETRLLKKQGEIVEEVGRVDEDGVEKPEDDCAFDFDEI